MARDVLFFPKRPSALAEPQTARSATRCPDDAFLSVLERMTPSERLSASRHGGFSRRERSIWSSRYPEEVPLVNGELEWIALGRADLD